MPFTPDADLSLAFDASLLPSLSLPPSLHLRPLSSTDHSRSHLTLLSTLTQAPDLGQEAWSAQYALLQTCPGTYYPIVIVDRETDALVGCGMLLLERKFIRGNGLVGHIEDIAVLPSQQGRGLGKKVIEVLTALSEKLGAYKVSGAEGGSVCEARAKRSEARAMSGKADEIWWLARADHLGLRSEERGVLCQVRV